MVIILVYTRIGVFPLEIWLSIAGYCYPEGLKNLSLTSRLLYDSLAGKEDVWVRSVERERKDCLIDIDRLIESRKKEALLLMSQLQTETGGVDFGCTFMYGNTSDDRDGGCNERRFIHFVRDRSLFSAYEKEKDGER